MKHIISICICVLCSILSCSAKVERYKIEVVKAYPHDTGSYTQGLFWHDGSLYESTGLNGKSTFRKVDLQSGQALTKLPFNKKYFVEGSVILGDKLYILTWTNKVIFIYDADTLEYRSTYSYPREGWGLTTDGKSLISSDGSSRIYFLTPELKFERSINVTLNGRAVRYLNELEWIDGRIWANVYTTDTIVIINPDTGIVEATVDCEGLLPERLRTYDTDVLNGIAVDSEGRIFLTGKNWPELYEVKLVGEKD
ncbi:MAG: glutaminyl-peptide cyclotransferase [Candidatus Cryptobacteroides sp.]|nr:glutaminyl-peptide cyclotransferase [Bacteroidales bacterium]MDY5459128.1 glutaminyl-peptide cyclotransferase [Candidatus Cryptobacteroides sp.]